MGVRRAVEANVCIWPIIASFRCAADLGRYRGKADFLAEPPAATATTDFIAADILNRCGRAYPALLGTPTGPEAAPSIQTLRAGPKRR